MHYTCASIADTIPGFTILNSGKQMFTGDCYGKVW